MTSLFTSVLIILPLFSRLYDVLLLMFGWPCIVVWVLSQPESRREGEPKKKTGLKRDWESPPQLFLENYGKQ